MMVMRTGQYPDPKYSVGGYIVSFKMVSHMMLRTDGTNYQNDVSKCPDEVKSASKYRKNEEQILALRYPN